MARYEIPGHRRVVVAVASPGNGVTTTPTSPVHQVLWDVIAELPLNERAAVVLRFYGGFTQAEIAAHLECPQGSVGPWIRRALNRMKEQLDD